MNPAREFKIAMSSQWTLARLNAGNYPELSSLSEADQSFVFGGGNRGACTGDVPLLGGASCWL